MSKESRKFIFFGLFYLIVLKKGNVCVLPLFIQTAGSLTTGSQPGHILMYAPRLSSLVACLHLE
ncbi:hypothetical protein AYY16_13535 [Morganella psychrotolerans]|nr:hypothetical protein AYY16_13535 [Morganella psychrotolerans]